MKKSVIIFLIMAFVFPFVAAQGEKIGISAMQESYQIGQPITFLVSLTDSNNNPLNTEVNLIFENAAKTKRIEKTIQSNKLETINLGENIPALSWTVTAQYGSAEYKAFFSVESSELARFEIVGDKLVITNVGNVPYTKDVQIVIGDTVGVKKTGIDIGESASFRLTAPDGVYSIRVTDSKTTLTKSEIALTGNVVVGAIDERLKSNPILTGTLPSLPNEESGFSLKNLSSKSIFSYVFVLILVGATVLLTLERYYHRLSKAPSS